MSGQLLTWTARSVPGGLTTDLLAAAQSDTAFVAVGTGTPSAGNCPYQIIRSADAGVTWLSSTMSPASKVGAQYYGAVAYGNARFVAGFGWTQTDAQPRVWVSVDDGVTFTGVVIPNFNGSVQALHFVPSVSGPGTFVLIPAYIVGGFGADYYTSQDGFLWTARSAAWISGSRVVDANTTALFHFDFDFRDSVTGAAWITPAGSPNFPWNTYTPAPVTIGNSTTKFGVGSVSCPGGGYTAPHYQQWLHDDSSGVPHGTGLNVMGGDFTIEMWVYSTTGNNFFFTKYANAESGAHPPFAFQVVTNNTPVTYLAVSLEDTALGTAATPFTLNAWHHVALVRQGTAVRLYLDGVLIDSLTHANTGVFVYDRSGYTSLGGAYTYNSDVVCLTGDIDELRVSNIARYSANFTPAGPFAYVLQEVKAQLVDDGTILTAVSQTGAAPLIGVTSSDLGTTWSAQRVLSNFDTAVGAGFKVTYGDGNYTLTGVPGHLQNNPQVLISGDIIASLGGVDYGSETNLEFAGQTGLTATNAGGLQLVTFDDSSYANSAVGLPNSWAYGNTNDTSGHARDLLWGQDTFLLVGHGNFIATSPWIAAEIAIDVPTLNLNCDCVYDAEQNVQTLAQLRRRLMVRLGFAASADSPPPGMSDLLNDFLQSSQRTIYQKFPRWRLRRFFRWAVHQGDRMFCLDANDEGGDVIARLDIRKAFEYVGLQGPGTFFTPLAQGIDPNWYTMIASQGRPSNYEIRSCIEIFPAANQDYYLWIKGSMTCGRFTADGDNCSIDSELLFLDALATGLKYYGKPDADSTKAMANGMLGQAVAASHVGKRYIPGVKLIGTLTPPRMVDVNPP